MSILRNGLNADPSINTGDRSWYVQALLRDPNLERQFETYLITYAQQTGMDVYAAFKDAMNHAASDYILRENIAYDRTKEQNVMFNAQTYRRIMGALTQTMASQSQPYQQTFYSQPAQVTPALTPYPAPQPPTQTGTLRTRRTTLSTGEVERAINSSVEEAPNKPAAEEIVTEEAASRPLDATFVRDFNRFYLGDSMDRVTHSEMMHIVSKTSEVKLAKEEARSLKDGVEISVGKELVCHMHGEKPEASSIEEAVGMMSFDVDGDSDNVNVLCANIWVNKDSTSDKDVLDIYKCITSSDTGSLHETLEEMINSARSTANAERLRVCKRTDRLLTDVIHNLLSCSMLLPYVRIDSFVKEYHELINYLKTQDPSNWGFTEEEWSVRFSIFPIILDNAVAAMNYNEVSPIQDRLDDIPIGILANVAYTTLTLEELRLAHLKRNDFVILNDIINKNLLAIRDMFPDDNQIFILTGDDERIVISTIPDIDQATAYLVEEFPY